MAIDLQTAWANPWYQIMAIINIMGLIYCAIIFVRNFTPKDRKETKYRIWMSIMGMLVALVSAYRAIAVRYIPYTFRIPNTFAEVSFAGLITYAMLKFNEYVPAPEKANRNKFTKFYLTKSPYILLGCLVLAQPIDTIGAIYNMALRGPFVETLWGIGFISVLPLAIIQLRRVLKIKDKEAVKRLRIVKYSAIVIASWCVVYGLYSVAFHLPGIWRYAIYSRFTEGLTGHPTFIQGVNESLGFRILTSLEYRDWGFGYLLWHTAYFSVITWVSLFLMNAPRPKEISEKHNSDFGLITLSFITIGLISLITMLSLPADLDEIISLIILGGILLVPIVFLFVFEIKNVKLERDCIG